MRARSVKRPGECLERWIGVFRVKSKIISHKASIVPRLNGLQRASDLPMDFIVMSRMKDNILGFPEERAS